MSQDPYNQQQPYGQPQQPYGQPQQPYSGAPVPPPPGQQQPNRWGPTSIGLEAHIAAGLGYLIPIIGLVFFFIEKSNRFVRFHGAQAITLVGGYVVLVVVQILLGIIGAVADNATGSTGIVGLIFSLLGCLVGILYFVLFAFQIWGIIAGFTGRYVKFPIVGDIAERLAGGPAVPAY
jgi:uncharacterized membrane protein